MSLPVVSEERLPKEDRELRTDRSFDFLSQIRDRKRGNS